MSPRTDGVDCVSSLCVCVCVGEREGKLDGGSKMEMKAAGTD